jgi:hypothetical protein
LRKRSDRELEWNGVDVVQWGRKGSWAGHWNVGVVRYMGYPKTAVGEFLTKAICDWYPRVRVYGLISFLLLFETFFFKKKTDGFSIRSLIVFVQIPTVNVSQR